MAEIVGPRGRVIALYVSPEMLAVLDWRPDARDESGPPRHHRLSPQQVEDFLRESGFDHIQLAWQDEDAYLVCTGQ